VKRNHRVHLLLLQTAQITLKMQSWMKIIQHLLSRICEGLVHLSMSKGFSGYIIVVLNQDWPKGIAVSLTFDFTNANFIIIFIGFLLFRCHKKRINWPCLFCLFRPFFSGNIYCCETCLCQKRTTTECTKNRDEKNTDDLDTALCDKVTCDRSVVFSRYSGFIHQ
jgi:hypothetical protein